MDSPIQSYGMYGHNRYLGQISLKFANFGLLQWLMSDIIAGVTVGIVVVPQGMGYAKIAQLPAVNYQTSFS
jgi:hypothetical protein